MTMLRAVDTAREPLSREEMQERGNDLATQIKRAAAEATRLSMIPDVFVRGEKLTLRRMERWRGQAKEAAQAWERVDALVSELAIEVRTHAQGSDGN